MNHQQGDGRRNEMENIMKNATSNIWNLTQAEMDAQDALAEAGATDWSSRPEPVKTAYNPKNIWGLTKAQMDAQDAADQATKW